MATMVKLKCANLKCGKVFERAYGEVNRKKNRGKPTFCSIGCGNQVNRNGKNNGNFEILKPHLDNKRDEYTPFRYAMKILRVRSSGVSRTARIKECKIDEKYLKEIWDEQNGKCPFTGWDLVLPDSSKGWTGSPTPRRASLDRIDNSKDYVEGNVRFVSVMFNYARNNFEDSDVVEFCKCVAKSA